MFVSDVVKADYKKWRVGDDVYIYAPTGTGKTTFVLQTLLPYAKKMGRKMLYLCNRKALEQQIRVKVAGMQGIAEEAFCDLEDVQEFDGITLMTYQCLQEKMKNFFFAYKEASYYVVLDEIHYVVEDAAFNPETQRVLKFLNGHSCVRIYLSATLERARKQIERYRNKNIQRKYEEETVREYVTKRFFQTISNEVCGTFSTCWDYRLPLWTPNLAVFYIDDYDDVLNVANYMCSEGEKGVIFVSNKEKGGSIKKKLGNHAELICAGEDDGGIIAEIAQNEKFSCEVLVTTKVLDNGVTIKDTQLSYMIIDTISETEFVQMLGRKRFVDEEDRLTLFIMKKSLRELSGYQNLSLQICRELLKRRYDTSELLDLLWKNEDYYRWIIRLYSWNGKELSMNPLGEYYYRERIKFLEELIDEMTTDEWAFIKKQLTWIHAENGFSEKNYLTNMRKEKSLSELEEYLRKNCNIRLDKNQQKQLGETIQEVAARFRESLTQGNRIPGKNRINKFLMQYQLPYEVVSPKKHRKGEDAEWIIQKKQFAGS